MDIKLGNLNIVSALEHPELLTPAVAAAVSSLPNAENIGVTEIDPGLSDTAAFCEKYEVKPEQAANCVIVEAKRADKSWFAACVILGSTRADINGIARRTLDARKVSFAPMDQAVNQTGMEYGAITPIGLPADWPILIDKAVIEAEYVILGSGLRKSKIILPGHLLSSVKNAQIVEGLGQNKSS